MELDAIMPYIGCEVWVMRKDGIGWLHGTLARATPTWIWVERADKKLTKALHCIDVESIHEQRPG